MAITKANELKNILETAEAELVRTEFIPEALEVANLATLFTNKTRAQSEEILAHMWELAEVYAETEGYTYLTLGKATRYGYSKGAQVFIGSRFETQQEMLDRCNREADYQAQVKRREASAKARQNKKDREELARLQAKLGAA